MSILTTGWTAAVASTLLTILSVDAGAAATEESFEIVAGRFCVDNGTDDDGLFNNGCGGPNYAFNADNRPSTSTEFPRRMRAALEYDISSLSSNTGLFVQSARLSLYFVAARDLTLPGFPPPASELLGYAGNGTVSSTDMLANNLLLSFAPSPDSFVTLDVTNFVRYLTQSGEDFAGFTLRIANDFSPGVFSDAMFLGELGATNSDPAKTPKLVIDLADNPTDLLQSLHDDVISVGPGKRLVKTVELAQTYYAVPDVDATCAVLTDFVGQVTSLSAGKKPKVTTEVAESLVTDAQVIMDAIGCN